MWAYVLKHLFYCRDSIENFHFQLGFTDADTTQFFEPNVTKIEVHPRYVNDPEEEGYDIALLKLDKSLTFQKNVSPICLPSEGESFIGKMKNFYWKPSN